MAIHVALTHKTEYRYDRLVHLGPQIVRLRPAPHCRTPILSYSLKVAPRHHFLNWQQDPQSNYLARYVFPEPAREFTVEVDLVAEMAIINPFDFFLEAAAESYPFVYEPALARELRPYLELETMGPRLAGFIAGLDRARTPTIDFIVALNRMVQSRVGYVIRMEPGIQSCEDTLRIGTGSCRDSAWLLVQIARHCGLAARFVSGYLIQLAPDQKPLEGPAGPARDFTDLHAWAEFYLPGAGWVGVDPTSGLLAGEGHIPLACTPDPSSAAPVSGGVEDCKVEFVHTMNVARIAEQPRVTRPYAYALWGRIDAVGHAVDRDLAEGDVRLTMGGEPTLVSLDDMDGPEWNTDAVGPDKKRLASQLVARLAQRYAPGGLVHTGQGKWYPGESLPRWAFGIYWRRDGDAIWANGDYLAREDRDYGLGDEDAQRFMAALSRRLGIAPGVVRPAFEDPFHYLNREAALPVNVDPLDSKLENEEERARIAAVFRRGLDHPVGYVLPINRRHEASGPVWLSSPWPLRLDKLMLVPGDSPIGFRLPLASLPWVAAGEYPHIVERDPFDRQPPLPPHGAGAAQRAELKGPTEPLRRQDPAAMAELREEPTARGQSAGWVVRTALCVEPRGGRLYVFFPPVALLEDYLAMVEAVEAAAVECETPVVIEGYPPPRDPRLNQLSVTPDPGVIEVNIHPASSWAELVRIITDLYDDARQSRLGTEKFMVDGRHVGTGGGNHVTVGGATAAESPFLRRPSLLRSLVGYWQNHPALSYLFAGLFIGPTSQAPRIDEARDDALYELEIAFAEIDKLGEPCPPWAIDRALRHLLTDVTGNTHRAEFCIDKLYSPDSATGRLGLVEMRAFEMPPHAQMSLTQQLLIRALIAAFWRAPYKNRLVRWGTQLHDRFMLPYFIEQDLRDVVADLNGFGYPFEIDWFAPHLGFRFPMLGTVTHRGIKMELRHALEPWHVLGEEPGGGGTVRFVDSSVERLQLRVTGMVGERHAVTCNGWVVPLHPTGTEGDFVAGVRFRAWPLPSALHPTIPVHAPLVFDLIDSWSGRSIGGCTYNVSHPGGRNFTTAPVNAHEAEGRRLARFQQSGHTPGPADPREPGPNPDFPFTLDLRRV
ncbi:MAG TPA: transglutaminase family protein [Stellaceae bacterium]|nr:transglutaminase family protein [Stellaceae bacterium]